MFSAEARLLFTPRQTYRALAASTHEDAAPRFWILIRRPVLWLAVVASFITFITAGRWVWFHVVAAMLMWSFVPLYESLFIVWIVRLLKSKRSVPEVVDLFFAGQGPWYIFFFGISALCLFSPEVWPTFQVLMSSRALAIFFLATIGWSVWLTFNFFRAGLDLSFGRSALGCATFYVLFDGTIAAWYLLTGQLYPLLFGAN